MGGIALIYLDTLQPSTIGGELIKVLKKNSKNKI
jgi:hypothetical protein